MRLDEMNYASLAQSISGMKVGSHIGCYDNLSWDCLQKCHRRWSTTSYWAVRQQHLSRWRVCRHEPWAQTFYFPPGLCTTKGQWAARTPPMATCRRHPSRRATCWVGTKWTLRCSNLQRSAAALTHKVLTLMLLWTREQMEGFGEDETKELIMASYSLLALRSVVTNLFLSLIKKLFHLTCIHAVVND